MKKLSNRMILAVLLGGLSSQLSGCAQTPDTTAPTASTVPQLANEAFAPPTKSQDQQMDKRNTVPQDFETHIIVADEAGRARAERIMELYEIFATNPTGETLRPFLSDRYIQHSTGVPNGRNPIAMLFASSVAQYDVKIDVHKIIVVGDWAMAHVNFRNVDNAEPDDLGTAAVDMYFFGPDGRVEEHWDVLQQVPTHSANANGMFVKFFQGE
ncbi:MAG: hypothetical protein AAF292_10915 [Pseudomonadota bacterium]